MEAEVQGSSPSNRIDYIDMDSLGSDSDEEYVDGIPHTEGISHAEGMSHADMIPHTDGIPHADGMSHVDETSYSHITPPRIK
jgi:hypothetical protein